MYFLYADESGDPGNDLTASQHFILGAIVVPASLWTRTANRLASFRQDLYRSHGLNPQDEFHASEMVRIRSDTSVRLPKQKRLALLRHYAATFPYLFEGGHVLTVDFDKKEHPHVVNFLHPAWTMLLNQYNQFLLEKESYGLVVADEGANNAVRQASRMLRNLPPALGGFRNSSLTGARILEDPFHRDSKHSYFIQSADVVAHLRYRQLFPQGSMMKYNLERFFEHLQPLVLPTLNPIHTSK